MDALLPSRAPSHQSNSSNTDLIDGRVHFNIPPSPMVRFAVDSSAAIEAEMQNSVLLNSAEIVYIYRKNSLEPKKLHLSV